MENNNIEVTNIENMGTYELADFLKNVELSENFLQFFKINKGTGVTIDDYTWSVDNAYDLAYVLREALTYIDSLEYTLSEQDDTISDLKNDVNNLEDLVDELEDTVWDFEREVGDLEEEVEELNIELNELEDKVSTLEDEVSNLEDEVNNLEYQLSEVE